MKNNCFTTVVFCILLITAGITLAQSSGPEFPDCTGIPMALCTSDEGVRLPSNNKIFLGEGNPEASSCSVHVSMTKKVHSACGKSLQYEVKLFLFDTSSAITLKPLTSVNTDSLMEADLDFDSELSPDSDISMNGIPYTSGCNRYHRIKWIVTDSCGAMAECDQLIDVYDCSRVLYSMPSDFTIINFNCVAEKTMHLTEIITKPRDDCGDSSNILFSFSPNNYLPDSTIEVCEVPAFSLEIHYPVWIADEGRDTNCNGEIEWNERNLIQDQITVVFTMTGCSGCEPEDSLLTGEIKTKENEGIGNVAVTLSEPGHVWPSFITSSDGKYSFYYSSGSMFTIHAERNDSPKNGVSTLDLVRIQKHLLGIQKITSPYDLIAADVNNSQSVSAIDLVELRKLILGKYTYFPSNKSWRFVPKNFVFGDPTHPWPFDESISTNTPNGQNNTDFIGIKIGDVNNSVNPNAQILQVRNKLPAVNWMVDQQQYKANEFIDIHFHIDDAKTMQGFQFTVSDPDLEFLSASSDNIKLSPENYGLFGDKMTFSWFDENGIQLSDRDIVFTIKARTKVKGDLQKDLSINSDITEAEMYSLQGETYIPVLKINSDENTSGLTSYSPEPNPWRENTIIPFYLSKTDRVTFTVFNLNGRVVYSSTGNFPLGNNIIHLSANDFSERGVLMYTLQSDLYLTTKKMIVCP